MMQPSDLITRIEALRTKALYELGQVLSNPDQLTSWRNQYLGRKSELPGILRDIKNLDPDGRAQVGAAANQLREELTLALAQAQTSGVSQHAFIDPSYEQGAIEVGHLHPVTQTINDIVTAFRSYGFVVVDGPEAELEKYNFDLLNIPATHPARDEWDTFWLNNDHQLLRTHTSSVQVRYLEKHKPPVRILMPGKVYRYEAEDASHASVFYQIEGLMVEEGVNLGHFKYFIGKFIEAALGDHEFRLRPSFFPFTEPSFEVDIKWGDKWLELMGGGMVHPNVLKGVGIDPSKYTGFAFGAGVERIIMSKHAMKDIRSLYGIKPHAFKQY